MLVCNNKYKLFVSSLHVYMLINGLTSVISQNMVTANSKVQNVCDITHERFKETLIITERFTSSTYSDRFPREYDFDSQR